MPLQENMRESKLINENVTSVQSVSKHCLMIAAQGLARAVLYMFMTFIRPSMMSATLFRVSGADAAT
jgi:hypothetical protein